MARTCILCGHITVLCSGFLSLVVGSLCLIYMLDRQMKGCHDAPDCVLLKWAYKLWYQLDNNNESHGNTLIYIAHIFKGKAKCIVSTIPYGFIVMYWAKGLPKGCYVINSLVKPITLYQPRLLNVRQLLILETHTATANVTTQISQLISIETDIWVIMLWLWVIGKAY